MSIERIQNSENYEDNFSENYYDILGIPWFSPEKEINRAYRKLALKCHPDKKGDPKLFKKISDAYSILQDPEKREKYNHRLTNSNSNESLEIIYNFITRLSEESILIEETEEFFNSPFEMRHQDFFSEGLPYHKIERNIYTYFDMIKNNILNLKESCDELISKLQKHSGLAQKFQSAFPEKNETIHYLIEKIQGQRTDLILNQINESNHVVQIKQFLRIAFSKKFRSKEGELDNRLEFPLGGGFFKNGITSYQRTKEKRDAIKEYYEMIDYSVSFSLDDLQNHINKTDFDNAIKINRRTGKLDNSSESGDWLEEYRNISSRVIEEMKTILASGTSEITFEAMKDLTDQIVDPWLEGISNEFRPN